MKRITIQLVAFSVVLVVTYGTVQNPYTSFYIDSLKEEALPAAKEMNDLYEEVKLKAKNYEVAPENAKVDKVWKLIPGYNGLKVDIKASYENMKQTGTFDETKLIYQQISPSVHIQDLPPTPIYRGHPEKPMVSLLINVAWGNEYIPPMLETLKKHHVKATFFLEGRWVKNNPDAAKMIVDAGHEIGNHSFSHPNMKTLSENQIKQELEKTNAVIQSVTGQTCQWFAPPSGSYRQEVVDQAAQMKLGTIMWSVDTVDWQKPQPDVLIQRVMTKIHPGAMVLMHPTEATSKALDQLITQIKQKGYSLGDVSDLLSEERIIKKQSVQKR
ncbi:polysaccharide deacetylase family protein [Priestia abyssalis]|uniref:polysaccharide deacetylase family protein n=1 Tax=Priestia abyssalis TaxID=1221450 RepID=UPI000994F8D6|nr:polysaccharide deacetylase family protein [Priestia abyssalis]